MKKLVAIIAAMFAGSATAQTALPDIFDSIGHLIVEKRPDLAATRRAPLSDAQIAEVERNHGITLRTEIKSLYAWHDGQNPEVFMTFANNMQFQSLEAALATKAELDGMIGYDFELENWWHPGWLPIFNNGGGDYIDVDAAGVHTGNPGQLIKVYHDWTHRPIVARNLTDFMQGVQRYLAGTAPQDMDEFHDVSDFLSPTRKAFEASGAAKPLR